MNNLVAALVVDGISTFELGVVCEVFGLQRPEILPDAYELRICAVDEPPLRATGSITIDTPYRVADAAEADTVVVPAWNGGALRYSPTDEMLEVLRDAHARGARILSVCSGAFALGHAGLLDGRRATTHWMYTDRLAAMFPKAKVDPDVLYVADDNVMTSAGTAAGIDLCLHLVRMDYGAKVANAFAPEHLQVAVEPAAEDAVVASLVHAGEILLGQHTPFSAANFVIGCPASLPTNGFARVSSGITAEAFLKRTAIARADGAALRRLAPSVVALADVEGFPAHAAALRHRFADL